MHSYFNRHARFDTSIDFTTHETGAFAAMALLGKIDEILVRKGVSMTIAPLGAVCAVLFATPASPGARVCTVFHGDLLIYVQGYNCFHTLNLCIHVKHNITT